MKHIFYLAAKDILQILRDRMAFLFLLAMPVVFTLMFSLAFGGSKGGAKSDPRLAVGFFDQDNSALNGELKDLIGSSEVVRLDGNAADAPAGLEKLVADNKLAAAVIVPAGYGAALTTANPLKLLVVADEANASSITARDAILAAAGRLVGAVHTAQIVTQETGGSFESAYAASLAAWQKPPVRVEATSAAEPVAEEKPKAGIMSPANTAPGMMLQFGIAGLLSAAQVLVHERKTRCLPRLLTTAVARHEILLGHFLALFTVSFVQFVILMAFGEIALKLDYLRQPLAAVIMAAASALFIAGLGLLIGALARTDEQAIVFAMITMFLFAGLGGAWVPLENTGRAFQVVGHFTPIAWAMDGFQNILVRGLDLGSIWLPAGAVLGYAALFMALAVWKFRFE
jgi:ABC-2 type transport system permease protein